MLSASRPGSGTRQQPNPALTAPVITMDGGRRLEFLRAFFSSEKELNPNRSFWKRALDFVAGPPGLSPADSALRHHDRLPWPHHRRGPRRDGRPHLRF